MNQRSVQDPNSAEKTAEMTDLREGVLPQTMQAWRVHEWNPDPIVAMSLDTIRGRTRDGVSGEQVAGLGVALWRFQI